MVVAETTDMNTIDGYMNHKHRRQDFEAIKLIMNRIVRGLRSIPYPVTQSARYKLKGDDNSRRIDKR